MSGASNFSERFAVISLRVRTKKPEAGPETAPETEPVDYLDTYRVLILGSLETEAARVTTDRVVIDCVLNALKLNSIEALINAPGTNEVKKSLLERLGDSLQVMSTEASDWIDSALSNRDAINEIAEQFKTAPGFMNIDDEDVAFTEKIDNLIAARWVVLELFSQMISTAESGLNAMERRIAEAAAIAAQPRVSPVKTEPTTVPTCEPTTEPTTLHSATSGAPIPVFSVDKAVSILKLVLDSNPEDFRALTPQQVDVIRGALMHCRAGDFNWFISDAFKKFACGNLWTLANVICPIDISFSLLYSTLQAANSKHNPNLAARLQQFVDN